MKRLLRLLPILCLAAAAACADVEPAQLSINGGKDFLSLDAEARSGTIAVHAPGPWRVAPEDPAAAWFSLTPVEGPAGYSEIAVRLEANAGAARSVVLNFTSGGRTHPFRLSQSAKGAGFDAPDHYFYVSFGTLPALYAGLHLLSHDKPGYVYFDRAQTFDPALFPGRIEVATSADTDLDRMRDAMKRRILEINAREPEAVFGLWVDDLRCRIGYDWFVAQGIDSTRVKVTMLTDGAATYNNFHRYFGDPATAERQWNAYRDQVEALDWNHGGRYPVARGIEELNAYTWPYYLSTRPGYRLMLQNSALLEASTPFMADRLAAMQLVSVQPYRLLTALPERERQRFYRMARFDYDAFRALFDRSPKPNLVILGTSHDSPESERRQAAYVRRVAERYGDRYDLFFKPHPADTSSADYPALFEGLTLLPGQMPFEIFVWSLLEEIDLMGGYPSTTYLSVPVEKVRFLFAADAESLVRPLNLLFRDAVGVEWMP